MKIAQAMVVCREIVCVRRKRGRTHRPTVINEHRTDKGSLGLDIRWLHHNLKNIAPCTQRLIVILG